MLCRYFQRELMNQILEDFLNAFHLLTLFRFVLSFVSFVPFSKALPLTTHTVHLIWQIFCFSLYVTAWYLFMDASLSEVFEGLYSFPSEVSLSSWTSRRRHHSDKDQHAHLNLQHPPSSVSLSSSSTRVLLQMQHYEAIITVSFTRKFVLGKDFQRHLK